MHDTRNEVHATENIDFDAILKKPDVFLTPAERNWKYGGGYSSRSVVVGSLSEPLPSIFELAQQQKAKREQQAKEFRKTGRRQWWLLHSGMLKSLEDWERGIPSFGCSCKAFYKSYKAENPPPDGDLFEWGVRLHNAVNAKLNKPQLSDATMRHIWRKSKPVFRQREFPVVSSVSPKKIARQRDCIASWIASGFRVILVQSRDEMTRCVDLFGDLQVEWLECEEKRPRIREMLEFGAVVNSDCAMSGDGPVFSGNVATGALRWNYRDKGAAREEEWGIDCWHVPKSLLHHIPEDMPFWIGKPFWDYAVPAFLKHAGAPFEISHSPWLLHEVHKLNWSQADWKIGHAYVTSKLVGDYSSPSYRRGLDSAKYNKGIGLWV